MSGTVADRKRLIQVTGGNLRQQHLYVNGHYDFFPDDCVGSSRKSRNGNESTIEIYLEGLSNTVETDISANRGRVGEAIGSSTCGHAERGQTIRESV
jgi:hypothetical protein